MRYEVKTFRSPEEAENYLNSLAEQGIEFEVENVSTTTIAIPREEPQLIHDPRLGNIKQIGIGIMIFYTFIIKIKKEGGEKG